MTAETPKWANVSHPRGEKCVCWYLRKEPRWMTSPAYKAGSGFQQTFDIYSPKWAGIPYSVYRSLLCRWRDLGHISPIRRRRTVAPILRPAHDTNDTAGERKPSLVGWLVGRSVGRLGMSLLTYFTHSLTHFAPSWLAMGPTVRRPIVVVGAVGWGESLLTHDAHPMLQREGGRVMSELYHENRPRTDIAASFDGWPTTTKCACVGWLEAQHPTEPLSIHPSIHPVRLQERRT